jgi:lysophospholipase L1-like esterase
MKLIVMILLFAAAGFAQGTPITIFLAGDSTMAMKQPDKRPETGWDEVLGHHFKDEAVRIENRAMNGRSTKTFISEAVGKIIDDLKKGDYAFIRSGTTTSLRMGRAIHPPEDYRKNLIRFVDGLRKAELI